MMNCTMSQSHLVTLIQNFTHAARELESFARTEPLPLHGDIPAMTLSEQAEFAIKVDQYKVAQAAYLAAS